MALLGKAVIEQYGVQCVEKFEQTTSAKKVMLLDDFDDGPVKASVQRTVVHSWLRGGLQICSYS